MNNETECDELLDDVFSEGAAFGFEAGLLEMTLSQVRRRRSRKRTVAVAGALAAASLATISRTVKEPSGSDVSRSQRPAAE